ncbi:hypothetical protein B9J78_04805 [bacterium Unc6]|nr:hypothetical protein [bacterium Unc6]MBT9138607.1 hypothetical protein [Bacillota bacterium]
MTLMRAFSRVDKDGKIKLPGNIQREVELKEGQLVELKIVGASAKKAFLLQEEEPQGDTKCHSESFAFCHSESRLFGTKNLRGGLRINSARNLGD